MSRRIVSITGMLMVSAMPMLADFTYKETTKITGGALVAAMKVAGVFSKQARQLGQPMQSTVSLKGDRLIHRNDLHSTIIDLGSQTITVVDVEKKTYSVMTFEEMKQALEQMAQKMQQQKKGDQPDMKFKVSANNTGKTKQINGFDAKETILRMELEGTDKKSGQSGAMVVIADTWVAPSVPGYSEVQDFYKRMAEKIQWTPNGTMFMGRADVSQGMAEVYKESAKLEGMPVFQTMTMGGEGTVPSDQSSAPAASASQTQADRPSIGSALGGALGGKFGLGRKKTQDPPAQAPAQGGAPATAPGVLMEMTTEMNDFSANTVDASQFEIPAGYKKVESDLKRATK